MNADIINPFLNATLNVLQTMTSTNPVPGKPCVKTSTVTFGAVTGIVGMAGFEMTGNFLISFDEKSILGITNRMLMEQHTAINQEIVDAVGEITNMICGGAKSQFSEKGLKFDMATPMVITGQNMELQQMSKSPILTIPFSTPDGQFVVETNLKTCNGTSVKT